MDSSILKVENVHKGYSQGNKQIEVLKGIDTTFEQNQSYSITGVSGSGKSTLLHVLGGLDAPDSGKVLFNKKNLYRLRPKDKEKFLNTSLGFVFQFHYLINELTVLENIMLMGLIRGESKGKCKERAEQLLKHVGLTDKASRYPFQLSGGEQQRISILRAIFNKPAFLLADEPTGNLDAKNADRIINFFLDCQKEWNMGLIICSHDKSVYSRMNNILEVKDGKLVVAR